ncbi:MULTISPECIES: DUF3619 family protein [unclassified Paraburkholderia]|uniref:DUF3619 family protein n=1 Tax=unclassified Paraburkholderia TaxID=2615204 RepID=UPI00197F54BB|nr:MULTISPECIES: DUF3619 family protein [unclassified Paraburkholderia]MBN3857342.1 DUF3619 family protein [Paraburkholderia sp. Ac-20340]
MSSALEHKELEFVQGMRRALDESAANLPSSTTVRLTAARKAALARKKAEPVLVRVPSLAAAGVGNIGALPGGLPPRRRSALARFALAWPLAALVAGLFAIAYFEDQQRTAELADIDAAMLSDDLPLTAYLDHGFNAYLTRAH